MENAFLEIAKGLAPYLLTAAGRRLRDEALGDEQERALNAVFEDATAVVLVEVARHDRGNRDLPNRLAAEFERFYQDTRVAETLADFALSAKEPPLEGLLRRYREVGNNPDDLPMDFGETMRLLVYEIADRLRKEASRAGSPLTNLVQVRELGIIRAGQEELVGRLGLRGEVAEGFREELPSARDGRDERYERGPDGALFDVLFAGFFLPSGPEGRFTKGGTSQGFEKEFLELFQRGLADHRLNTSGIKLGESVLSARVLDYRPSASFAGDCDYESFSEVTGRLAEGTLGVVWGTVRDDGGLGTLEVLINPDRFYGGPQALMAFSGIKRLADREDLPSRPTAAFAARTLAAMWAQSFCAELDRRGMHAASYTVASDSRRLVERSLDELSRELGLGHPGVEEQRRGLLPGIVRQEASSLWQGGDEVEAIARLLDALKIWPYGPLSSRGEFREFCESIYAFSLARRVENFERFLAENYGGASAQRKDIAWQYAQRALVGLPPVDLELFVNWLEEAQVRGIDVEGDAERWFAELADVHPEESFILAYWGEARRVVAVRKYGAGFGSPTSWRMDRAAEKFEEAYRMAPDIPYFVARVQAIRFTAATAFANTNEGRQRFDEAAEWWQKAKPYYREHAPWMLKPAADEPERLGQWVGEEHDRGGNE